MRRLFVPTYGLRKFFWSLTSFDWSVIRVQSVRQTGKDRLDATQVEIYNRLGTPPVL